MFVLSFVLKLLFSDKRQLASSSQINVNREYPVELETKAIRRFVKISQLQRRPLHGLGLLLVESDFTTSSVKKTLGWVATQRSYESMSTFSVIVKSSRTFVSSSNC